MRWQLFTPLAISSFILIGCSFAESATSEQVSAIDLPEDCTSDDGISTIPGFRITRFYDTGGTNVMTLTDVEVARGPYAPASGREGLLFTTGIPAGGIGRLDAEGNFDGWLVQPGMTPFPRTAYLEYSYGGLLYACDTVDTNDIWRIHPDGVVEWVADYPHCEGISYGDMDQMRYMSVVGSLTR